MINKPVVLFGTGRSGTTVLMEALFRHRELAYLPSILEKKPEWLFLNYSRYIFDNHLYRIFGKKRQLSNYNLFERFVFKPSEAYPVWNYILQGEQELSRGFLHKEQAKESLRTKIHEYLTKVQEIQGKSRFALKLTGPSRLFFLSSLFPDGKFIWLKRAFIPTLNSFLKVNFWQGRSKYEPWWHGPYNEQEKEALKRYESDTVLFTAIQLKKILDVTQDEIDTLQLNVFEVDYENMVTKPHKTLESLLDYCGLSYDKYCFKYLNKNRFVNRNLPLERYFNQPVLSKLEKVLQIDFGQY